MPMSNQLLEVLLRGINLFPNGGLGNQTLRLVRWCDLE